MADKFDDKMFDDDMLEDLFASAKSDALAEPSPDLMARVLESAETVQADQQAAQQAAQGAPQSPSREAGGWWRALLQALGGWPSLSGVAVAGLAGVWIGVSSGTALMQNTLGLDLYGEVAQTYLSDLDVSYALTLGVEEE
ncbi:hypothetical protein [Shimia sp.]|uniref:hypothetical protein n=1 Tax=Shimia sp. TaxID=1954381 RepID=UPI003BACFFE8